MSEMCEEVKLTKLKKMIIDWAILEKISFDEWWKYKSRINDNQWIKKEGLNILLSDEVIDMLMHKTVREVWKIVRFFITRSSVTSRPVQHSLVQLCTALSEHMDSDSDHWNRHRVLCWVVKWMVEKCPDGWLEETCDCLAEYSVKLIEQCTNIEKVKWIIVTMERWWSKMKFNSETKHRLMNTLKLHTSYLAQVNITSEYEKLNSVPYQTSWCAQWCIDKDIVNVLASDLGARRLMPLVKLSSDGYVARNDHYEIMPVRSSLAVTSGVCYYEVIPLTGGELRFGWATREAKLSDTDKKQLGDDEHSICLGVKCHIYHGNHNSISDKSESNLVNSVFGCLIDVDKRQFVFYFNGEKIESKRKTHFSSLPYYATGSLNSSQQCMFNFGQIKFKYPPKDDRFKDTPQDIQRYQLTETAYYNGYFWFQHHLIDNRVDLFYSDQKQSECDKLVRQCENTKFHKQITELDHSQVECGRLIQSVIEMVNRRLALDFTDTLANWVRKLICKATDFEKAKLIELLYPYHCLSITSENTVQCHNVSTILILLSCEKMYFKIILPENFYCIDYFLSKTVESFRLFLNPKIFLTHPCDMINYFKSFEFVFQLPHTVQALLNDPSIKSTLWWCAELFGHVSSVRRLYEPSCDLVRLQAGTSARWFRDHLIEDEEQQLSLSSALNPLDKTEHIKLSCDRLSARNDYDELYDDHRCQSVRSGCSASFGIFYYEAVLLTGGKMTIGWATKQTDLNETRIGGDEYSIGFDGSDGHKIYHQGKNLYVNSIVSNFTFKPRWSVGDVVGCLIDCKKKRFRFYLNGRLIKYKDKFKDPNKYFINFFDEPYCAAISLLPRQQFYLNLGQCSFKHPPNVRYRTLHLDSSVPLYSPRLSECYSLIQVLVNDRVELLFDDEKQEEFDEIAQKIVENDNFDFNIITEVDLLRLIQSMIEIVGIEMVGIEMVGTRLPDSGLSAHVSWIIYFITQVTSDNPTFPDLISQLLYPYFTLHLTNDTVIKHRNVCIVLASLILTMDNMKARIKLYQQVFTYLTEIIANSDDECIVLFVTICLGNMDLNKVDKQVIQSNSTIMNKLNEIQSKSFTDQDSILFHQLHLCVDWFLNVYLKIGNKKPTPENSGEAKLNKSDENEHLKLSSDQLTARSDHRWQSVRSICLADKAAYYEVTLHTNGPMRIGYANKRTNLCRDAIGSDHTSIGYDGYNQCIWHGNRRIEIKTKVPIPRWKSGDIVGCSIDVNGHSFAFYQNHQLVYTHTLGYFSDLHRYFAAASLPTFQQCRFNFGPTQLPPAIEYNTFNSLQCMLEMARGSANSVNRSMKSTTKIIKDSVVVTGSKMFCKNIHINSIAPKTSSNANKTQEEWIPMNPNKSSDDSSNDD